MASGWESHNTTFRLAGKVLINPSIKDVLSTISIAKFGTIPNQNLGPQVTNAKMQ